MRLQRLAFVAVLSAGCRTTVDLAVHNPTPVPVAVSADVLDNGRTVRQINLGTLAPKSDIHSRFTIKPTKDVQLRATTGGYETWISAPVTVGGKPDPHVIDESVALQANLQTDANAVKTVLDQFAKLGKDFGMLPLPAKEAAQTYLGSLLLIVPPDTAGAEGKILLRFSPSEFLGQSTTDISYPAVNFDETVQMNGSTAASLASQFPLFNVGINYSDKSLYEFEWKLAGMGNVLAAEPAGWNVLQGLNNLSQNERKALSDLMAQESKAVLLYVNRLFVIRQGYIKEREAKQLAAGAHLGTGTFLTAEGAYTFEGTTAKNRDFGESVLNIGGEVISVSLAKMEPKPGSDPGTVMMMTKVLTQLKPAFDVQSTRYEILDARRTGVGLTLTNKTLQSAPVDQVR